MSAAKIDPDLFDQILNPNARDVHKPTMVKTGRRKGGKNKPGHKAGGDRRSATAQKKSKKAGKGQATIPGIFAGPDSEERPPPQHQKTEEECLKEELESKAKGVSLLKEVLEHPSHNFGSVFATEESDDDDVDYDTDMEDDLGISRDKHEQSDSDARKQYRRSYLPPRDSVVGEYLYDTKEKVKNNELRGFNKSKGQKWIPPSADAVSLGIGSDPLPNRWYLSRVWIYVWLPLDAYCDLMPKNHPCPFCDKCDTTSQGYYWRPMIWMEKVVYILHQRFRCKNRLCCGSPRGGR